MTTQTPRPRGRPPADPQEARSATIRARVTQRDADKFSRLGGADWLRRAIERAKEKSPP